VRLLVWSDGAARGNPGPAGFGAVVTRPDGEVLAEIAEGIGVATNNVAEYRGAMAGLDKAAELGAEQVELRADSKLLIEQLAGRWRVKNPTLQRLHAELRRGMGRFRSVELVHVPRAQNTHADRLANQGVDAWLARSGRSWRPIGPPPRLFDPSAG
jgi:ribonuclease HI